MPKSWDSLTIKVPRFDDAGLFLTACGKIVVDEIIKNIGNELRPDGSPQKQNSANYRDAKKRLKSYTTPLWGISGGAVKLSGGKQRAARSNRGVRGQTSGIVSPYLARPGGVAWLRDFIPPDKVLIHLNEKREEIGRKLTEMGYWFVGITRSAESQIAKRTVQYFRQKIRQMASKD
jgi:hypothetical protein